MSKKQHQWMDGWWNFEGIKVWDKLLRKFNKPRLYTDNIREQEITSKL